MNLNHFFSELKRRNVLKVASIYAVASWVIIQVSSTVFPEFNMPEGSVRMVILLCLIGFPIALVLAWGFELVPDAQANKEGNAGSMIKSRQGSSIWTTIVVAGLGLVGLGFFFYNTELAAATTTTVEIENESGELVTRQIPKLEYTNRFLIFPIENKSGNPDLDWLKAGIPLLIDMDLEQDSRIFSTQPTSLKTDYEEYNFPFLSTVPFAIQLKMAKERYADYFVTGDFSEAGDSLTMNAKVYSVEDGELFYQKAITGKDYYEVVDVLTESVTDNLYLEATSKGSDSFIDLPASDLVTPNKEAFKNYMQGEIISSADARQMAAAKQYIDQSVSEDPNCATCYAKRGQLAIGLGDQSGFRENFQKALDLSAAST